MTGLLLEWFKALGFPRLIFIFTLLVILVWSGPNLPIPHSDSLDYLVLDTIRRWIPESFEPPLVFIYKLSGTQFTGVLVISLLFYFILRSFWADFICLFFGTAGILGIIDRILKPWFDRPRPDNSSLLLSGASFPSGHAAGSIVFYFMSCTLLITHYPRLRLPLFLFSSLWVSLVWLSTLYCRAHWPSDIVAGASVGFVWLSMCLAALKVWESHKRLPSNQR
tara:strand:+ start:154 stop:819 length:666 start_codon:yes stop_codon:yes gene_type:complete